MLLIKKNQTTSRFFPDEQTLDRDFSELTVSPFNFIENAFVLFAGTFSMWVCKRSYVSTALLPNSKKKGSLESWHAHVRKLWWFRRMLLFCSFSLFLFTVKSKNYNLSPVESLVLLLKKWFSSLKSPKC